MNKDNIRLEITDNIVKNGLYGKLNYQIKDHFGGYKILIEWIGFTSELNIEKNEDPKITRKNIESLIYYIACEYI